MDVGATDSDGVRCRSLSPEGPLVEAGCAAGSDMFAKEPWVTVDDCGAEHDLVRGIDKSVRESPVESAEFGSP